MRLQWRSLLRLLPLVLAVAVTTLWLIITPDGLLGKADGVGYAICHRIDERSFHIADRQVPMCARCTGMYLGAMLGLAYTFKRGRKGKLPPYKILAILILFFIAFGVDGLNSYLHFFPGITGIYEPNNLLRLITGTGLGLSIALVFLPVFHQTIWMEFEDQPAIRGWKDFLALLVLAAAVVAATYIENPLLLYPLALISAAGVLILLTLCYMMVWTLAFNRDNKAHTRADLWWVLLLGFSTAMTQLLLMDSVRLWFTHTWGGFAF